MGCMKADQGWFSDAVERWGKPTTPPVTQPLLVSDEDEKPVLRRIWMWTPGGVSHGVYIDQHVDDRWVACAWAGAGETMRSVKLTDTGRPSPTLMRWLTVIAWKVVR